MLAHVLTAIVFTLLGGLGYTVVFGSLENFAARRAADKHTVGQFQQAIPLVIAVSLLLIAMRVINMAANAQGMDEYWLLINLQLLIMMYTDLMIDSFWAFLILKIVDGITFAGTGVMTIAVWFVFIVVGLALFFESHYAKNWSPDNPWLFAMPPLVIDALFWVAIWFGYRPAPGIVLANFGGFAFTTLVIFFSGRSQRSSEQVMARLTHETQFDALTGVRNWAMFQTDLTQSYAKATPDHPLGVMTFDLDHFKAINDTHGHLAGNAALKAAAQGLDTMLQHQDPDYHVYRTGGEEFAVILPNTTCEQARQIGLNALECMRRLQIVTKAGELKLTASFGMTQANTQDRDATATFRRADQALYVAKNAGRDRLAIDQNVISD
jgi:diguanylate cyclase (GGDEF)-like protein